MVLHPKPTTSWLKLILHPFGLGTSHGRPRTHLTHHGPDSEEATTFPHIVFSTLLRGSHIPMALFPETPKEESRNYPGLDSRDFGNSYLLALTSDWSEVWTKVVARELSNAMSHSFCRHREEVDSRLLMVGSQIASLTLGLSFAHNLGCRCPNSSCKAILDIYTSRPFQWYKEHPNARCFDPYNRALSFWESQRTPSSHFWECEFHPHT